MGSHYPTAVYLKEVLFPHGKIMGWMQGNYSGFPLFYHYFPLPFISIALLSYVIPMQISFKLITILGTLLLPICTYFTLRLMKYPFPIPSIGAVFSIIFLFNESNSMWGGNIPSTLAGEFSYSLSLALMVLFIGSIYYGINNNKNIIINALLIFLLGFSHGFTLIFSFVISSFFIFTKKMFLNNFKYLFKIYSLGGLLLSFWFLPFISTLPFVTEYVDRWRINSILEVLPIIMMPLVILGVISLFMNIFDRRTWYFAYLVAACFLLYQISPSIGLLDIRFVPFIQLFLLAFAATFPLIFLGQVRSKEMLPMIVFLIVILWTAANTAYIKNWVKWNYEGFEQKASWQLFSNINAHLSQTYAGRVVYEHSPLNNSFGTERAFENLPYFAKRNTLEGLYMQSSISSPFVFYIQSEISKVCSTPFPQYKYSNLNLPAAMEHLALYNVTQYIARSPEAKLQARSTPGLKLEKTFDDYEIYRLANSDGHYVVPLKNEPILLETSNWKKDFFEWFIDANNLNIPLVYLKYPSMKDKDRFKYKAVDLSRLITNPIKSPKPIIKEELKAEEIDFTTNLTGYPHMIKVSYHPNWKVEGADKIYLVSPSFMLVYPNKDHVRLYFGKTAFNYVGEALSLIGLSIILFSVIISFINARKS
ncbi:hypothetical protein HZC34_01065 [Candidatus Saganbacteria bacterium]|nr:hypothetical protein [Candidatus Saganbacteria bacterium]